MIISAGLWSQTEYENNVMNTPVMETAAVNVKVADVNEDRLNFLDAKFWFNWISSAPRRGKSALRFWKSDMDFESQPDIYTSSEGFKPAVDDAVLKINKDESRSRFPESVKESFREAIIHLSRKWYGRLYFFWRHAKRIIGSLWDISGIHLNLDIPKWLQILHLDRLNSFAVHWLEKRSKAFEPTFLYTMEKGYFLLPEGAKLRHNIRTTNISISARHSCFGNRWQQLLINRLVGYDTILMNSLLNAPGQGYLYNYQTKEFYNLTYAHEQPEVSVRFGAFMQHLILYFWNRFEVPALQRFMLNRRSNFQQHPDFHITSSTILASTLHITRVNKRNSGPANANLSSGPGLGPGARGGPDLVMPTNGTSVLSELHQRLENQNLDGLVHPPEIEGQPDLRQEENGGNPGAISSFSSMLLWLLGGVYSESFNSILSIFRDGRVQGQVYAESPPGQDNPAAQGGR